MSSSSENSNTLVPCETKESLMPTVQDDVYKILEGSSKHSALDNFCLLIPESDSERVLKALQSTKNKYHTWRLEEESIPVAMIQQIPSCLAHCIGTIPDPLPQNKTEEVLLNYLLTGGSLFVKAYVTMKVHRYMEMNLGESRLVSIECRKKEHVADVYKRCKELWCDLNPNDGWHIEYVKFQERSEYLVSDNRWGKKIVANKKWLKRFLHSKTAAKTLLTEEIFGSCRSYYED